MKCRLINTNDDEITIITEDGGIACIREAEALSPDEPRIATTDYYQMRLTNPLINAENVFEVLSEGKMYYKDWADVKYNSFCAIQDALEWLCVGEADFEVTSDLFTNLFGEDCHNVVPSNYLEEIHNSDAFELLELVLKNPKLLTNSFILNVIKQRNAKLALGA